MQQRMMFQGWLNRCAGNSTVQDWVMAGFGRRGGRVVLLLLFIHTCKLRWRQEIATNINGIQGYVIRSLSFSVCMLLDVHGD
ncbi:unnamed protein product [Periconia digitata]|uniref:Uncharacterized protein n=1 Tax=Periconia digitata TaxID=1303443 RepID=A0A9W4UMM2_9PLEO|nr:unnamed protein product [Periconia digitata]